MLSGKPFMPCCRHEGQPHRGSEGACHAGLMVLRSSLLDDNASTQALPADEMGLHGWSHLYLKSACAYSSLSICMRPLIF